MKFKKIFFVLILVLFINGCNTTNITSNKEVSKNTNMSANVANGSAVTTDEDFIYYINYNDESKLYKVKEDGSENLIVANNNFIKILCYKGAIYFTERINNNSKSMFSKIDVDGTNYQIISENVDIWNFIIIDDTIYAIGDNGKVNEAGFKLGSLMKFDINNTKKWEELDKINHGYLAGDLAICNNQIYYTIDYSLFQYNLSSQEIKELKPIGTNIQEYNGNIYSFSENNIYKYDCLNSNNQLIYENKENFKINALYVTDKNLIFSVYDQINSYTFIYISDHDGNNEVKIYQKKDSNFNNFIYVINNKVFILDFNTNIYYEKYINVIDLNGKSLWSL